MRFEHLGLRPGMRVLDVGCGGGRHIRQTRLIPGITAVGVDLGASEVKDTAKMLRELDEIPVQYGGSVPGAGEWTSMRGSVYELPFADESFDCVIISEVLEHLGEDERALREISRVLKAGGTLACSVPRRGPETLCWALSKSYRTWPGGHIRIYRQAELRAKLERQGYQIYKRHFAHALHSPYWWLKCGVGLDRADAAPVKLYHRFLVWDMMRRPALTRFLEIALQPFIGKSVVFYGVKAALGMDAERSNG
ncbi:MAG TPA: methyltransferase domain-containing protein [Polyangiales bacterium]|jgi:ubiquinone/menaquinone biosynthesis C-methylase UbiE|nr:methyltransferase domain-containing protein [Polyangiales bacterium]